MAQSEHGEIIVIAVGNVEAHVLKHVCASVAKVFGRPCRIGAAWPKPDHAFDVHRVQYSAEAILAQLRAGKTERVLGVVDLDLFVPQLNFVFGLADPFERRAVIALPRLRESFYGAREDEALFLARAVKEAVHELGHTYGLSHCRDRRCVMAFSNSLIDTDYKGQEFCAKCKNQLGR
jgi:archaemetzincin